MPWMILLIPAYHYTAAIPVQATNPAASLGPFDENNYRARLELILMR